MSRKREVRLSEYGWVWVTAQIMMRAVWWQRPHDTSGNVWRTLRNHLVIVLCKTLMSS